VQRLREQRDDLYIMSMPPADLSLQDVVFRDNPLVLIAAARDPLVKAKRVAVATLAERRFILRELGSGTRMAVDRHFRRLRFRPDLRMELGSNEAIKEAVAGGLGIGVISLHALHGRRREHGVAVVDARDFPISSQWHLVHPGGRRLSPAAAAFRDQLLATAPR
jgi:DNA-binding transcriptional LysR family regulator